VPVNFEGGFNGGFRLIPLRTFVSLPPAERGLILRTLPLVAAIRVALWVAPLRRVRQMTGACERLHFSIPSDLPVSRLEWAVRAASRRVPMASCLTQALALQFLLASSGRASEIQYRRAKRRQSRLSIPRLGRMRRTHVAEHTF